AIALLNVGVQLSVPRWVAGRALAGYQASLTGGVAVGAALWGHLAAERSIEFAFFGSGIALIVTPLIALLMPIRHTSPTDLEMIARGEHLGVALAIAPRSAPSVIEIDYGVTPAAPRQFYDVMLKLQRARQRNGAFEWSVARDLADPELWTERYHLPTW